ncbi:MAG TPA: hypothetical protein VGZ50_02405, partial [Actinomycetota bacterium]|nr:hypothetical protein [Actinomycetota bacterium]
AGVEFEQVSDLQGQQLTSTSEGVVDFESGDSEATVSIELPGQEGQEVGLITKGTIAYMEAGALPGVPANAKWLSIDLEEAGQELGFDIEALRQNGASQLAYLTQTSDAEEVGTESVRDVDTTHYTFTTDLADLAANGPEELRASYKSVMDLTGLETIPTEVWVDGDDLVRRLSFEVEIEQSGQQIAQTTTIEYFDFGVEVDVQAPPPNEVVDFSELSGAP